MTSHSKVPAVWLGRGVAVALATVLSTSAVTVPALAYAASSEELQSDLDQARAQVQALDEQISSAASAYESSQADLEQTESDIETVRTQIDENSAKMDELRSSLSEIMVSDYKDQTNVISVLLGVSSFDELVSAVRYYSVISDEQSSVISEALDLQDTLNKQKDELEQKLEDQKTQTQELADNVDALSAAQQEQQAYVDSLSSEVQAQLEAERQAAIEAERQAAEQAAAEAAAAASQNNDGAANNSSSNDDSGNGQASNPPTSSNNGGGSSNNGSNGSTGGGSNGSSNNDSLGDASSSVPSTPTGTKQAAVNAAMSVIGTRYVTNGSSPSEGFDCSGLVWWAYRQAGVSIPRSQRTGMYPRCRNSGTWTRNVYNLAPGDLIFYGPAGSTTHVAMYIGGGKIVHANGTRVAVSNYDYSSSFLGGGSVL